MSTREAFEEWHLEVHGFRSKTRSDGTYDHEEVNSLWEAWQAALSYAAQGQEPVYYQFSLKGENDWSLLSKKLHDQIQERGADKFDLRAIYLHPQPAVPDGWDDDAYKSACDGLEYWKRRAEDAEQALERVRNDMGPEHMGEPVLPAWAGWACQQPGKLPRLYGAKEIAELNYHPEEGDALIYLISSEAQQPAVPERWISVNDGLPEIDVLVLWVCDDGHMFIGERDKDDPKGYWVKKCTHWMPLPRQPRSDNQDRPATYVAKEAS